MKNKHFERLYRVFLFIGALSAATPVSILFFVGALSGQILPVPAICAIAMAIGYFLQSVLIPGALRRGRSSYIPVARPSLRIHGLVPMIFCVILAALTLPLWERIYYYTVIRSAGSWQSGSPLPLIAVVGVFLCMLLGIVLRFIPTEAVASARGFIPACVCAVFLILIGALAGPSFALLSGICFAVFLVCILLLFNQAYISRDYSGSVVSVITPEARLYNMRLVCLFIGALGVLALFSYVMISGITTLFRMLLFTFLYDALRHDGSTYTDYEYYDPEMAQNEFLRVVFKDSAGTMLTFYIAILILAVLLLWLLLRRSTVFVDILNAIRQWFLDFISFWVLAKEMMMPDPVEILNYKDKKESLSKASVRDYQAMTNNTNRYEEFMRTLRTLRDTEEQISFAYLVMLRVLREKSVPLRSSDTPRESRDKIHRAAAADVAEITDALEHIKYAGESPDTRGREALREICTVVKKYLG